MHGVQYAWQRSSLCPDFKLRLQPRATRLTGQIKIHLCRNHKEPNWQQGKGGGREGKAAARDLPAPPGQARHASPREEGGRDRPPSEKTTVI